MSKTVTLALRDVDGALVVMAQFPEMWNYGHVLETFKASGFAPGNGLSLVQIR